MADLIRSRPPGQPQQQQFAMGLPSSGQQQQQQQQPFHDQQPSGFNLAMQNMQNPTLANRTQMLLNNPTNPSVSRQLELMLAQNQHPQNSQMNYANRMAQHQQHQAGLNGQNGLVPPHNDPFVPDGRRPSPSQPQHQQPPAPNQQIPQNGQVRRPVTQADLLEKVQVLRNGISQNEMQMRQLQNSRAGMPDTQFLTRMRQLQNDATGKKEFLGKILAALNMSNNANSM
jgi:hypothetical protein